MFRTTFRFLYFGLFSAFFAAANAEEFVLGEKTVAPGILFVFEAAPRDNILPAGRHLPAEKTDIHLEVLASWLPGKKKVGEAFAGGFVPYMEVSANVSNEKTGDSLNVDLVPHVNLVDAIHYARNIALPGAANDLYTVEIQVNPPYLGSISFHSDWVSKHGEKLFERQTFVFKNINFAEVVKASR